MTIAVVACWPWGRLKSFGIPGLTEAVVIAADTRFSYSDGRDPFERGLKLYMVSSNLGLVFSGRVRTAQRAINDLAKMLKRVPGRNLAIGLPTIRQILLNAHAHQQDPLLRDRQHRQRPASEDHLDVLFGGIGPDGRALGVKFSSRSSSKFEPEFFRDVQCIGDGAGFSTFYACLERTSDMRFADSRLPIRQDDWSWDGDVAGAIWNVIAMRYPTIGGNVQSVTIWPDRVVQNSWLMVKENGDPSRAGDWDQMSAPLADLKPAR